MLRRLKHRLVPKTVDNYPPPIDSNTAALVRIKRIEERILVIRGQKVIVDADLAPLYGVPTKALNQAVRRNRDRFPGDFMFALTDDEKTKVVTNCDHLKKLKTLGARIPSLRKEQGISQRTMADTLGIAQQTYAHYEVGRIRMPVSMLPAIAQFFGVSVDELLGRKNGAGKRGPAPRLQQQIERLSRLPKAKQKFVMEMLEGVLGQASR